MAGFFELLLLWLFLAIAIGQVIVAVRALGLEHREGLAPSRLRVGAAAGAALIVGVLVIAATSARLFPEDLPEPPPTRAELKLDPADPRTKILLDLREERKALLTKASAVADRIDVMEIELGRAEPAPVTEAKPPGRWSRAWRWLGEGAVLFVPLCVVLGLASMFLLGNRNILLHPELFRSSGPRGERAEKARDELDAIASDVEAARYREAVELAETLDPDALDSFDRLDWAYLRGFAIVHLCLVPDDGPRPTASMLSSVVRQLKGVLEQAPARGEAAFILGIAQHLLSEPQEALDAFAIARSLPSAKALHLPENESVCLLQLAEAKLTEGDAEAAGKLFDRVTELGALVDRIPNALVKIRLLNVRKSLQGDQLDEAKKGLDAIRQVTGLDAQQRKNVEAVCDAIATWIAVREGNDSQALESIQAFLNRHLPAHLPSVDDTIADEHLESPIDTKSLPFSPQIYRAFLFLSAGAQARLAMKAGGVPSPVQARAMSRPLLLGLLFELRQRDLLAALGGIYFWFVPERRENALQWLESAVDLGAESRVARRILERERRTAQETRHALDWFRSASSRFLQDPTLHAEVREAMIEEMSRFQEFRPLLQEYAQTPRPEPREPTLRLLRERAGYLDGMVADFHARNEGGSATQLETLRLQYVRLIDGLDTTSKGLADLEKKMVHEVGRVAGVS